MGFLSKITKPFKKIWKGIKKVGKKVWGGVKKFVKSKIGKLIIAAVVIYFTMGAGAAALGGTTAGTAAAGTTVAGGAAGTAAAGTAAAGTAAAGTAAAGTAAAGTAAGLATAGETAAALTAGGATTAGTIGSGLVGAAKGTAAWMAANPIPTMIGGQMLSSGLAADPAEEAAKMEAERRRRSNIAGVSGTGEGDPISLGLIQQAQQQELAAPTYNYKPGAQNGG